MDSTRHNLFDARSVREDRAIVVTSEICGMSALKATVTLYDSAMLPRYILLQLLLLQCTGYSSESDIYRKKVIKAQIVNKISKRIKIIAREKYF